MEFTIYPKQNQVLIPRYYCSLLGLISELIIQRISLLLVHDQVHLSNFTKQEVSWLNSNWIFCYQLFVKILRYYRKKNWKYSLWLILYFILYLKLSFTCVLLNLLSASFTKWSNTFKQFVGNSRRIVWIWPF